MAQKQSIVLIGCVSGSDKRGGVKNSKFLRTAYMNSPYIGSIRPVCAVEGKTERKRRRGNGMASWSEGGIE